MVIKIISILTFLSFAMLYTFYKVRDNQDKEKEEITYKDFGEFRLCNNVCYKCEISEKCWELLNHMEV